MIFRVTVYYFDHGALLNSYKQPCHIPGAVTIKIKKVTDNSITGKVDKRAVK